MTLAAPEHQEINGQAEVTWITLRKIAHSLMVHARTSEAYINFALIYTTYHIFLVIPIKDMINNYGDTTTPYTLATCTKPSVSHLRVLFCPYVVQKDTAHVRAKALNMHQQAQKGFRSIFVGITKHQKGYLVYIPSSRKIISSYDVVFDENFSSELVYTSQNYSESMAMLPAVAQGVYITDGRIIIDSE